MTFLKKKKAIAAFFQALSLSFWNMSVVVTAFMIAQTFSSPRYTNLHYRPCSKGNISSDYLSIFITKQLVQCQDCLNWLETGTFFSPVFQPATILLFIFMGGHSKNPASRVLMDLMRMSE